MDYSYGIKKSKNCMKNNYTINKETEKKNIRFIFVSSLDLILTRFLP